ncbi:MAG TPA: hypothetical protein VMR77_00665 [Patescibacteria group bacterium]|jgi:hypothetical protein|nr:hypothetical protein [Patescibacteria group bacterium]
MKKQKITVVLTILTLLTTALFVVQPVFAQTTTNNKPNFFQGLITFIEQKFGLDKTQVATAISQYKSQVKANVTPRPTLTPAQIQAQEKARLDKLVSSGKITSDQETAILAELNTLNAQLNGLTGTQRKTQMQTIQSELKTWAQTNGINLNYIPMFAGFGGSRGGVNGNGFHGRFGPKPTATPSS